MSWRHSLRTKLAILQAVRELQRDGVGTITQSAVAVRSGFDRATVRRHFPHFDDILHLIGGVHHLAALSSCIEARSADEPSLCMATHAFLDTVRSIEGDKEMDIFLGEMAEFLGASPNAPAIVLDFFMLEWFEPLSTLLANRHGRPEPDLYDRHAVEQIFVLSRRVLDEWRREDYKRQFSDVAVDLVAQLGHHQADGSCLFAPPPH